MKVVKALIRLIAVFIICSIFNESVLPCVYAESPESWKDLYLQMLQDEPDYERKDGYGFGLYYIDDDKIPELVTCRNEICHFYTIDNSKVVRFIVIPCSWVDYKHMEGRMIAENYIIKMEGKKAYIEGFCKEFPSAEGARELYFLNGKRVSDDEYKKLTNRLEMDSISSYQMLNYDEIIEYLKKKRVVIPVQKLDEKEYKAQLSCSINYISQNMEERDFSDIIELTDCFGFDYEKPRFTFHDESSVTDIDSLILIYSDDDMTSGLVVRYTLNNVLNEKEYTGQAWSVRSSYVERAVKKEIRDDIFSYMGEMVISREEFDDIKGQWKIEKKKGKIRKVRFITEDTLFDEGLQDPGSDGEIYGMDFEYDREDKLKYRCIWHNMDYFGTYAMSEGQFFDDSERLIYTEGYQTHGSYEKCYLYYGNDILPSYCLYIDYNQGLPMSYWVRYR